MIYLAADHAGFELKEKICHYFACRHIAFEDFGTFSKESVDYPGFAKRLAKAVINNNGKGILFCASGQGMAITANRIKGARASVCWNEKIAIETREDNDANIISLAVSYLSFEQAKKIISAFLSTSFSHEVRHKRRIAQIDA